jgi:hypothetical protein
MSYTNVKSEWVDGNLVFSDKAGAVIFTIDGTNRKFTFPSGSELELASGAIADFSDEALAAADIALAEGSILVGNAAGAAAALDAKGDTKVLVGNATTITSVALSGDVTMDNAGAVTLAADSVDLSHLGSDTNTWLNDIRTYVADGMLAIATITVSAGDATDFKTTTTAIYRIAGTHYTKAATDTLSFSAADTINTGAGAGTLWGIWLVQINAAGTVSTKPGAVDMTYANEAAAIAALPAVDADNIQIGYITVQGLEATEWVANTGNLTVGGGAGNVTARSFYDLPTPATLPAAL